MKRVPLINFVIGILQNTEVMSIRGNNNVYFGSPSSDITSDLKIYGGVIAHSVRATKEA